MEEGDGTKANHDLPNAADRSTEVDDKTTPQPPTSKAGGGWGGWGFSVFSDLSKAAEEISRNVSPIVTFSLPLKHTLIILFVFFAIA
jgi:hypothetical protein